MTENGSPHLTHVEHTGRNSWTTSCDGCDWSEEYRTKGLALEGAELHWLSMPLVT